MPNHVRNVLKFSKLKQNEREFIIERFTRDYDGIKIFDLKAIVPEPQSESECPDDCKVNKASCIQEDEEKPWFDWYKWRNKYWGTKWNTYDGYMEVNTTTVMFVFSTAWSTPDAVYEQLAKKYPDLIWEVRYADEDYGSNCGKIIYNPDKTGFVEPVHYLKEEASKDPVAYARQLWRNY